MGNSGSNSTSHRRRRNSSSRRNSLKGIDSNVEKFFTSKGLNNNDVSVEQILRQFSQSFIIKTILVDNSKESHDNNDNKLKVDLNQVKQIFSDLFGCYSNTALVESYVSILFQPTNDNEFELVESVFQDCLVFSLKAVGFKRPKLSDYSKKTLNNMVRSIQFTNEGGKLKTSQSNIKDWIMNNFPLLFNGFNHWLSSVLKEQNPAKIENVEANDLSHFMNLTMIWYLINNLPNCYTKDLASENGTLFEKLKNCLTENRWHPLYQSENHGLSLNRFQANLFNYKAGTMVFIFCKTGSLYCICSNEEYKESPTAYGDEQTRIVRIWDEFKDYEIGSSGNIYLNTKSRFLKLGLIFGYSNQLKPVLKISEDLHWADHELSSNDEIIAVEGWACGSSKAASDQASMKKWENKQLEKMRTVNRGVAGGWGEEKAILDLAGVKTEHSERGDI